ncbi:MAG: hypothetical protein AAGJ83_01730 [Planctomycetota bacterium]
MSDAAEESKTSGGSPVRKFGLYIVLLVMLGALGYDYLVARPSVDSAFDRVSEASQKANASADDYLSRAEVSELIGKGPADTFMDGSMSVEEFRWMGGLIVKPHRLFVVYKKTDDDWMVSSLSKAVYDKSNVGSNELETVEAAPEDEEAEAAYDAEMEAAN